MNKIELGYGKRQSVGRLANGEVSSKDLADKRNKYCAVYWDIENIGVNYHSAFDIISSVRNQIIRAKGLKEIEFICACGNGKLPDQTVDQILSHGVGIEYVQNVCDRNAADMRLIEMIRSFAKSYGPSANIVLLSGDSDFVKTIVRCKTKHQSKVYLVHFDASCSPFLDCVADETYLIDNGKLRVVTRASNVAVVRITLPTEKLIQRKRQMIKHLLDMFSYQGMTMDSVLFDPPNHIWIGFSTIELAKSAALERNGKYFYKRPLIVKYVQYPPEHVTQKLSENGSNVRDETIDILKSLIPSQFSLSRSPSISSVTSTVSLPFKSNLPYLVVTGFPKNVPNSEKRQHLSQLLGLPFKSFWPHQGYILFHVNKPYKVKKMTDLISNSNFRGVRLTVSISKKIPEPRPKQNNSNRNNMKLNSGKSRVRLQSSNQVISNVKDDIRADRNIHLQRTENITSHGEYDKTANRQFTSLVSSNFNERKYDYYTHTYYHNIPRVEDNTRANRSVNHHTKSMSFTKKLLMTLIPIVIIIVILIIILLIYVNKK